MISECTPDLRYIINVLSNQTPPTTPPCRLGLLSDAPVDLCGSAAGALSSHLQERLCYAPGERDAVFLHHTIEVEWADGSKVRQEAFFIASFQ